MALTYQIVKKLKLLAAKMQYYSLLAVVFYQPTLIISPLFLSTSSNADFSFLILSLNNSVL